MAALWLSTGAPPAGQSQMSSPSKAAVDEKLFVLKSCSKQIILSGIWMGVAGERQTFFFNLSSALGSWQCYESYNA